MSKRENKKHEKEVAVKETYVSLARLKSYASVLMYMFSFINKPCWNLCCA